MNEVHYHEPIVRDDGSSMTMGFLLGIVVLALIIFAIIFFNKQNQTTPATEGTNINVHIPNPSSGNSSNGDSMGGENTGGVNNY